MKIPLTEWAKRRYDPPPSDWVLRKWAREGELYPQPELVGRAYYVDENARRLTGDGSSATDASTSTLVDRLKAREHA